MVKRQDEKKHLSVYERWIIALVGFGLFAFAVYLVFSPPLRHTIINSPGSTQTTDAYSDQSTVAVFLMTAGAAFFFYAINGLRMTKFAAGPLSGESESGQGTTPALAPSPVAVSAPTTVSTSDRSMVFGALTSEEKKIMRTLWRYQRSNFRDKFSTRWTFKVFPNAPEYPEFLRAVAGLLSKGFISVNPANDQCALTNEGIILLSSIGEEANNGDFYIF